MIHPLHEKFARLLTGYSTEVQKGDHVLLNVDLEAVGLARALVREVLRLGAVPLLRLSYPEQMRDTLELLSDAPLEGGPVFELREIRQVDAWIRVGAPANLREPGGVDKERLARFMRRSRPVQDIRVNETRWLGTLFPTPAQAQDAGMGTEEFERFAYGAMFLFEDDPAAAWRRQSEEQAAIVERLERAREIRIVAEGTDLKLSVAGRSWVSSAGRRNMPCGEVFTGPVEDSAEGTITFDVPSSVSGVEVRNVEMRFEQGKAVYARAEAGDGLLQAQLDTDAGARFLGELGIGTNYRISRPIKSILFDEKIGGTVHLALGQSYAQTGGTNTSAIHWDMIADLRQGGAIFADGEKIQENGKFLV